MSRKTESRGDGSTLSRERMQFVIVIARLLIQVLKILHGWPSD